MEVVSYRLRVRVAVPKYEPRETAAPSSPRPLADAVKGTRSVSFNGSRSIDAMLYERDRLDIGATVAGPAHRRAVRRHHRHSAGLDRAGRRLPQPDPGEGMNMDAITIQILRNKIASLVDEMHYHFYRSGYSTIIRESRDFTCVILDRNGRLIVAPPMFFHAPVYRHLVGRILDLYGGREEDAGIKDGDVFVSNHPYEGGLPHVSDMAFVAPVFADGELVAFSGSIAHKADVGGAVAGSTSANATEMFHEGLLLPPIKICGRRRRAGRYRAHHPRQQPAAGAGARRHPRPDRGDADGRDAGQGPVRALRRGDGDRCLRRHPQGRGG